VLDTGLVVRLGVITSGWHGSVASQSLNTAGAPVCVTITLTDGLVLARSVSSTLSTTAAS
jgi:hypothetical protein